MSNPKLLMLDEPSMGLAPILIEQIFQIVEDLHKAGTTVLLVEQNAQMALSIATRGYVLETGKITMRAAKSCCTTITCVKPTWRLDSYGVLPNAVTSRRCKPARAAICLSTSAA